jgi:hypothetical protein
VQRATATEAIQLPEQATLIASLALALTRFLHSLGRHHRAEHQARWVHVDVRRTKRCGRSPQARDVANAILADQGGIDQCSESRKHLIRRFAAAAVLSEQIETQIVNGEPVDIAAFAQLSSTLVRITNHLGLERIPKMVNGFAGEVIDGNVELPERPSWSSPMRDALAIAAEIGMAKE